MHNEYVIIENQEKNPTMPDKKRIFTLLKKGFNKISSDTIYIEGKRKEFELYYKITCCATTGENSTDNIYNLTIEPNHDDKKRCAELLETAHKTLTDIISCEQKYHLIVANDELSEYYCNRAYPKYQKFERQLRHLIFKVVTKAYGNLWAEETINKDLKKKLKEEIKTRSGGRKEDLLIEQALHEMSMGQLIDFLFYGEAEILMEDYIDEYYPSSKLESLSKEELISLIEKFRKKSVWNLFLSKNFDIDEPRKKLNFLRQGRNKVAHCKKFYSDDYYKSTEYINTFLPQIDMAIENENIVEPIFARNVVLGLGDYAMDIVKIGELVGQIVSPALKTLAEIGASFASAMQSEMAETIRVAAGVLGKVLVQNMKIDMPKIDISVHENARRNLEIYRNTYKQLREVMVNEKNQMEEF